MGELRLKEILSSRDPCSLVGVWVGVSAMAAIRWQNHVGWRERKSLSRSVDFLDLVAWKKHQDGEFLDFERPGKTA